MKLRTAVIPALLAAAAPALAGGTCLLGAGATASATCASCHGGDHARAHPVDVDYAVAALRRQGRLRAAAEVVARGVFLPEGRLQCVSCHDAASPWAAKLALPPGAAAAAPVRRSDAASGEARPSWRNAAAATVAPGDAVSPAPLCAACHAVD